MSNKMGTMLNASKSELSESMNRIRRWMSRNSQAHRTLDHLYPSASDLENLLLEVQRARAAAIRRETIEACANAVLDEINEGCGECGGTQRVSVVSPTDGGMTLVPCRCAPRPRKRPKPEDCPECKRVAPGSYCDAHTPL